MVNDNKDNVDNAEDVERQGVTAESRPVEQYGAVENNCDFPDATKPLKEDSPRPDGLPLVFGYLDITPADLLKIFFWIYVAFFVFYRIVDIHYLATVDGRFPDGLGSLYPSEWERQQTVSYTRQVLGCGLLAKVIVFCVISALVLYKGFSKADDALQSCIASVKSWCSCGCLDSVCSTIHRALCSLLTCCGACEGGCCTPVVSFFSRVCDTLGCNKKGWRELLHGATYISCFAALFFLLTVPFMVWMHQLDIEFGFTNTLSVTPSGLRNQLFAQFLQLLIFGIPGKFIFLFILQMRFGWVLMWSGMCLMIFIVQDNVTDLAPMMMGMNNKFPATDFTVARGFPLVQTNVEAMPWLSLNRLYFPESKTRFVTKDKSVGPLVLTTPTANGPWVIAPNLAGFVGQPMAHTVQPASADISSEGLGSQEWSLSDGARMGVRHGKSLIDKVQGFAKKRHITVQGIYLVDGSHKDVRANAFVAGNVNGSVIGLYDTLFLGEKGGSSEPPPQAENSKTGWGADFAKSFHIMGEAGEAVVATEHDGRRPAHSAPTASMTDDEILGILAHELGHAHYGHMARNMYLQVATSFVTFATMGWMAHSPVVAAAFSVAPIVLHVMATAFERVVSPPLDSVVRIFSDGLTRKGEYEADTWVARADPNLGTALQTSLAKLSINANQDPDVPLLYEWLHFDHPCFRNRYEAIEKAKKEAGYQEER